MKIRAVILAAGRGERMNSALPKALHKIFDRPMLQHVIDAVSGLKPSKIVIVAGKHSKEIKNALDRKDVTFVLQKTPRGTGDALLSAKTALKNFKGTILVLNGDTPLIPADALAKFLRLHDKDKNDISLMSFFAGNPAAYGRIMRDDAGKIMSIIEDKDATMAQKAVKEVNSGVYAFKHGVMNLLGHIRRNALKGEYYLTDIVGIAKDKGYKVNAYCISSEDEMAGVNTISELLKARQIFKRAVINKWIEEGVVFIEPDSVFISPGTVIGKGTTIYPNVHLEGKTKIGGCCTIYPNVRIVDSKVGDSAIIKDSTVIESSVIRMKAVLGPFAHIRPGCDIGSEAKIGNFVEVKKSVVGKGTKASHLSYIGDASIGRDVNIGAGTITCNYDGRGKHKTIIKDDVFIGSDTQLVAPVTVGRGAYVGAGSTITKCVPSMSLALSRPAQRNIKGWVKKRSEVGSQKSEVKKKRGK